MTNNDMTATVTMNVDDLKVLAEVMVDYTLNMDRDTAPLTMRLLNMLKREGIRNAAELCRDQIEMVLSDEG